MYDDIIEGSFWQSSCGHIVQVKKITGSKLGVHWNIVTFVREDRVEYFMNLFKFSYRYATKVNGWKATEQTKDVRMVYGVIQLRFYEPEVVMFEMHFGSPRKALTYEQAVNEIKSGPPGHRLTRNFIDVCAPIRNDRAEFVTQVLTTNGNWMLLDEYIKYIKGT
jgi:hypothetical protein